MAYPAIYKKAKKKAATKKKVVIKKNPVRKKRTPAQIRATKRLVAANKKKAAVKRKVAPKKKVATKRKTNPRKTIARKRFRVLCVVPSVRGMKEGKLKENDTRYWTGTGWSKSKNKAVRYPSIEAARNEAQHLPKKYRSGVWWSYATEVV